jgi:hypothetical protein
MTDARVQASLTAADLRASGSLGGLQILNLLSVSPVHQRIVSVGREPLIEAGFEKTRFFFLPSPVGFFWVFWGFLRFLGFLVFFGFFVFFWFLGVFGFFGFFLYICPEERVFRVFQFQEYF